MRVSPAGALSTESVEILGTGAGVHRDEPGGRGRADHSGNCPNVPQKSATVETQPKNFSTL